VNSDWTLPPSAAVAEVLSQIFSRGLRKNSIYTQHAFEIFHMAPMSKQVQDAQKRRSARPQ
jgi:hypothetical protein